MVTIAPTWTGATSCASLSVRSSVTAFAVPSGVLPVLAAAIADDRSTTEFATVSKWLVLPLIDGAA
jgi:hypothetical protein